MCGIFGYLSQDRAQTVQKCLQGLKRLEYRGYDSAGIAGIHAGRLVLCKQVGRIDGLKRAASARKLQLDMAIAHTRWATHGKPNALNAHPHTDTGHRLAIVHNGIIENHLIWHKKLEDAGISFRSETDSEVIAQLIAYFDEGDILQAFQKAIKELQGCFAIALIHKDYPDQIFAAVRDCPLTMAISRKTKEAYLTSDPAALSHKELDVLHLQNDEIAVLRLDKIAIYDKRGQTAHAALQTLSLLQTLASKGGFAHFMLKEICEQGESLTRAMAGRLEEEFGTANFEDLDLPFFELQAVDRILILACGSSWHAGSIAKIALESLARIPTEVEIASEFRYTNPILAQNVLVLAISQSGETADTLAAVREVKAKGAKVIGICNAPYSTLAREAHRCLFLKAGPEISVCSTKAFTSQLLLLVLFALFLGRTRHLSKEEGQSLLRDLKNLPKIVKMILAQEGDLHALAQKYAHFRDFFFLGRRYMYPTSLEAALKLKEISYLNASGYPAGEMKHGPIALICPTLCVVAMCGNLQTWDKLMSNLMEIKARGAPIVAFAPESKREELATVADDLFCLPEIRDELASIPYSIATQLFAYFTAKAHGTNIDKPRNLAKSVTVE